MDLSQYVRNPESKPLQAVKEVHWTHHLAAIAMVTGAVLLVTGRKRQGIAIAVAGATGTLLERPQAVQELWAALPGHIRNGQDFLVRAESLVERLSEQAARLREILAKQGVV